MDAAKTGRKIFGCDLKMVFGWMQEFHRSRRNLMNATFETIPVGTKVTWHYRSAIGHGTVKGVHERGTNADNTMYSITQHDHHPGEPAIVVHSGKALTRSA
jgi:hypothetical protein